MPENGAVSVPDGPGCCDVHLFVGLGVPSGRAIGLGVKLTFTRPVAFHEYSSASPLSRRYLYSTASRTELEVDGFLMELLLLRCDDPARAPAGVAAVAIRSASALSRLIAHQAEPCAADAEGIDAEFGRQHERHEKQSRHQQRGSGRDARDVAALPSVGCDRA